MVELHITEDQYLGRHLISSYIVCFGSFQDFYERFFDVGVHAPGSRTYLIYSFTKGAGELAQPRLFVEAQHHVLKRAYVAMCDVDAE
ncbi:hypothetical protein D3C87_1443210 [compost metagenome]